MNAGLRVPLYSLLLALLAAGSPETPPSLEKADRLFAEHSYQLAKEAYLAEQAKAKIRSPPTDLGNAQRWLTFRIADSQWRAASGSSNSDRTELQQAKELLEQLAQPPKPPLKPDRIWAEAHESLGDFAWRRRGSRDWYSAWQHYDLALDFWAGSSELTLARERYLGLVWKAAEPPEEEGKYRYGSDGRVSAAVAENVLKLARTPQEKSRASFLYAMGLRAGGGSPGRLAKIPDAFEAALSQGKASEWHDDALFEYAQWLANERQGRRPDGSWGSDPDYPRALGLYLRLLSEYRKGESAYFEDARQAVEEISRPNLEVAVSTSFQPGADSDFQLAWRNIKDVRLALYAIDLTRDLSLAANHSASEWIQSVRVTSDPVRAWTYSTHDRGDYRPGQAKLPVAPRLPAGAYLLQARAGQLEARDVLLVTDATVLLKSSATQAVAYFAGAHEGEPVAQGRVTLWQRRTLEDGDSRWESQTVPTDADGLARFALKPSVSSELVASAMAGPRQAIAVGSRYDPRAPTDAWRILASTDRPAYRPEDTVQWKLVARQVTPEGYATPAMKPLDYVITDPRGAKVTEGHVVLNAFGSAWGTLPLNAQQPLGEYRIELRAPGHEAVAQSTLFRLEEYKLPELRVSVTTPEVQGKKKVFRLGDTVEAEVKAEYYFGGPVAGASVEVLIHQHASFSSWRPPRPYPWLYPEGRNGRSEYDGGDSVISRQTLTTDAQGVATVRFDTPVQQGNELEYRIEARVTDASRREVSGSDSVKVSEHAYAAFLTPAHTVHHPGDVVSVALHTVDANGQPVSAPGEVKVTRNHWEQTWRDPQGNAGHRAPDASHSSGWRLMSEGYTRETVLTRTLRTSEKGDAELRFDAPREGYYRIVWTGRDGPDDIVAETTVFSATLETEGLGYRSGGLELLVDQDTVRVGQRASVLISTDGSHRCVLFSVASGDGLDVKLVRMPGSVKLVEVPIREGHVPNLFLAAASVSDEGVVGATRELVVPPVEHYLEVQVTPEPARVQPGESGRWRIDVQDAQGKPVATEVAFALVDEAVFAIQQDYVADPRAFFFGQLREDHTQLFSFWSLKPPLARVPAGSPEPRAGLDDSPLDRRGFKEDEAGEKSGVGSARGAFREVAASAPSNAMAVFGHVAKSATAPVASAPAEAPGGGDVTVQVRHDFRATAAWVPDAHTDATGKGWVDVKYPDTLTRWKATARAATVGDRFGAASGGVHAQLPFMVRLQAPRFFVAQDETVISAVIDNLTDQALDATVTLAAEGLRMIDRTEQTAHVGAHGQARVDWRVRAVEPGVAKLRVVGRAQTQAQGRKQQRSDAMEKQFVVVPHGVEKLLAQSGRVPESGARVHVDLPARRPGSTEMVVQLTPSLAATLLDALPYLVEYPYGCTEQTLSRFLPSVVVAKTLRDQGIAPAQIAGKLFGGIEPEAPSLQKPASRGPQDLRRLDAVMEQGLSRLYDFQHGDGGWGWWKEGTSDRFMSAYVVFGLSLARDAGAPVRNEVLQRGVAWLETSLVDEERNPDAQAWLLHALAVYDGHRLEKSAMGRRAFDNLWKRRDALNAYTRALFALSAQAMGAKDRAQVLIRNLEDGVVRDRRPDVSPLAGKPGKAPSGDTGLENAHWGSDGVSWRWSEGGVEASAFALRALLAVDAKSPLVDAVAHWLIRNRRGAHWSNTRDTAVVVLALDDYLKARAELSPAELSYEVKVNGHALAAHKVTRAEALDAPSRFVVKGDWLRDGANEIEIQRTGRGSLYFSVGTTFFSAEEPVTPAGNELFVRRQYFREVPRLTLLKGTTYDWRPLEDGGQLKSGDRVQAVLTLEAKNHLSYVLIEDAKPAGLESVEVQSGEGPAVQQLRAGQHAVAASPDPHPERYTGQSVPVHAEWRDRKAAFFLERLPEGIWELHHTLRAEVPGTFHALPTVGHAMYVPEIRGNGAEARLTVHETR